MRILAIETSCDETALAIVEAKGGLKNPRFKILKNLVASQIKIHRPFGGVVPNLAKREHLKNLPILYKKLVASGNTLNPDLIAVTVGPGLEPALWTGINFAREIYSDLRQTTNNKQLKLIGVSHLEGHLYSNILENIRMKNIFPSIPLIVSGGHTILLLMKDLTHYKKLGETRDDAVGEAFDKVARLLNLSYPGGPEIEKLAKKGNHEEINFPRPMINQKNYDFSFSGLKTAVLYYLKNSENLSVKKEDVAASFQRAAFDVLISKTLRAVKEFSAKSIMISGGVATNNSLRNCLKSKIKSQKSKIKLFFPEKKFCADNAVMIAVAGYINYLQKKNRRLSARGNLRL
ncbi:MAG: tRNA (adenosine(37)-N6)-threonylcarbamoyltransferase complex transferase subunit TsaD [Patescibacteria group bacterium]